MVTIAAPTIGYALLLPFIIVFAAACVGVLAEAVVPRDLRHAVQLLIAFVSIAIALVVTVANWRRAYEDGAASFVVLASTSERALDVVPLQALSEHAVDVPADPGGLAG